MREEQARRRPGVAKVGNVNRFDALIEGHSARHKAAVGDFDKVIQAYPPPPAWPTTKEALIDYYTQAKI